MDELEDIAEKHRVSYTLVCLYIKTLGVEQRESLAIVDNKYDRMRFHAKAMRSLVENGLVLFDWECMEATLTKKGLHQAEILIQEITGK